MPFKLNPFTNRLDYYETGSGPGSGITSIAGDTGSITGANVTIYANQATNNSGASVFFTNSGTVSTLNTTDNLDNTFLGKDSGNTTLSGGNNGGFGVLTLSSLTIGDSNTATGSTSQNSLTTGLRNTSDGVLSLQNLVSGNDNTALGYTAGQAYTGSESNNICIGSGVTGTVGENNVTRIGNGSTAECFIQGIASVTTSNSQTVTIDTATGQLGSTPNSLYLQNIISSTIDFKTAGVVALFTPASNFLVTEILLYTTNVSGVQSGYIFNVGFTPPNYTDYVSAGNSGGNTTGFYTGFFDSGNNTGQICPGGQAISIDITTAELTATVSQGVILIQGVFV